MYPRQNPFKPPMSIADVGRMLAGNGWHYTLLKSIEFFNNPCNDSAVSVVFRVELTLHFCCHLNGGTSRAKAGEIGGFSASLIHLSDGAFCVNHVNGALRFEMGGILSSTGHRIGCDGCLLSETQSSSLQNWYLICSGAATQLIFFILNVFIIIT